LVKLQGLKKWLESNVVPLTHKILDITGRADFVGVNGIQHKNYDTKIINIKQNFSPYDFKLNEAYLMPVNSGSSVYTCQINFSVAKPEYASDCFKLKIRTYQTHKEWQPLRTYSTGDKIIYFEQIYESVIDDNRMKNPRKYDSAKDWSKTSNYQIGDYVSYFKEIYQYVGTQSSQQVWGSYSLSPVTDIETNQSYARWVYMTEWKKVDYLPIQTLSEFRTATHSYNFTVDSNLDPFIEIEVTSDNGYGQVYTNKKNYEIRGLKDLQDDPGKPEPMGSFNPIVLIQNTNQFEPTLSANILTIEPMETSETREVIVTSSKSITYWEIVDQVRSGCLVYIDYKIVTQKTIKVLIKSDSSSQVGNYQFRIRGYVIGGYYSETELISGSII
jgi:hypothetical protein